MDGRILIDELLRALASADEPRKRAALQALQGTAPEPRDDGPLFVTVNVASRIAGISRSSCWRLLKAGTLKKWELAPGMLRLRRSDVLALAQRAPVPLITTK